MATIDRSLSTEGLSLYKVLGVEKNATESQIKKAYHKKALSCHPDKHPDDETKKEEFQKLNKASAVLRDERKRRIYDKMGSQGLQLVDMTGIETAEILLKYDKWYYKWIVGLCFLFSGCGCLCCCCFCCCFGCCCGQKCPKVPEEEDLIPRDEDDENNSGPITTEPTTTTTQNNSNDTPIVLGQPTTSTSNSAIPLGDIAGTAPPAYTEKEENVETKINATSSAPIPMPAP